MPLPDLGAADPEELAPLLGVAYAVALLLPPALTPRDYAHGRGVEGTEAALWIAAGVDPAYVIGWLQGEAARLQESLDAPTAPPLGGATDCRSCQAGEHGSCDGTAVSDLSEHPVPCTCPDPAHDR